MVAPAHESLRFCGKLGRMTEKIRLTQFAAKSG